MSLGSGSQEHSDELLDDQQFEELQQTVARARRAAEQRQLRAELKELEQSKRDFDRRRALQAQQQLEAPKRAPSLELITPTAKRARTAVSAAAKVIAPMRLGLGTVSRAIKSPQRNVPNPSILQVLKASERARNSPPALGHNHNSLDADATRDNKEDKANNDNKDDDNRSKASAGLLPWGCGR